jgi:hypothetical protein
MGKMPPSPSSPRIEQRRGGVGRRRRPNPAGQGQGQLGVRGMRESGGHGEPVPDLTSGRGGVWRWDGGGGRRWPQWPDGAALGQRRRGAEHAVAVVGVPGRSSAPFIGG